MDDRYQIKEKIGQGGLGAVYRAFDAQLKREVAMKRLLPPGETEAQDPSGVSTDNLLTEATTLSSLQHPNIVTIYDVGKDEKGAFVVMELLRGETFDVTVERGALPEKDFRSVVAQTQEALVAAHHQDIVHRDLKPSNLMVSWLPTGKFQIKILDFGLAKFSKKPAVQTIDQGDAILGSIYFMAPEQFERVPLDVRTDLYSIGALYHYCLTGQYPFDGDTAAQVMAAHLQHRVKPLHELRPDLPRWMCDWVMWLISREMADRPQSAQQALDFFQEEKSGLKVAAKAAPAAAPVLAPVAPAQARPPQSGPAALGAQSGPLAAGGVAPVGQVSGPLEAGMPEVVGIPAPAKKSLPIPVWAMVTIPILLIALLVTFLVKSGAKREIDERNQMVQTLNEAERPRGDASTVAVILEFMNTQPKTEIGKRNWFGALTTLRRLEGGGVDDAIVAALPDAQPKLRSGLIGAIAERGITSAISELLKYIDDPNAEVSDAAVYALGVLGNKDNVSTLLAALADPPSDGLGDSLANSIILISQKNPDLEKRSIPVRSALKGAEPGEYRNRLLKILGHLGGERAWEALKKEIDGNDNDARRAVLLGLASWPDGNPAEEVFKVVSSEQDPIMKGLARRTYILLLTAPSDSPEEDKVGRIKELFSAEGISRTEKKDLIGALSTMAVPAAKELAEEFEQDETFGAYGEMALKEIKKSLAKVKTVGAEDLSLHVKEGLVMGESGFEYEESRDAITGWSNPAYHVVWPIKFDAPGEFEISVTAAAPSGGGEYELRVGGARLTEKIGSSKTFEEAELGSVSIKNPGTYRLTVMGLKATDPDDDLMELRSVTLKKK